MAGSASKAEELLKRSLYVFDLPEELLATLTTKLTGTETPSSSVPQGTGGSGIVSSRSSSTARAENEISTATTCSVCQVSYQTLSEQRDHVRSDHHRYNIKARLHGNRVLDELEFNKAIGELDESISGSDSESESDDAYATDADAADNTDEPGSGSRSGQATPDSTLSALLKRQAKLSSSSLREASQIASATAAAAKKRSPAKQPLLWFTSPLLEKNTFLGIYRALFTDEEQDELDHLIDSLRRKQTKGRLRHSGNAAQKANVGNSAESPHFFLCMVGGGHFAAMVVALKPEIHKRAGLEERQAIVLAHKTFHRYTTRRKQGGAQSTSDAAKGAAHSAGSTLRRYNEAALENEIRQLLQDWRAMIETSQLLFVRAAGTTNRKILFGAHEGQVLRHNDPRIRGFPFSTRRATQSELMRAFTELTRLKVSHIDEATLAREETERQQQSQSGPQTSSLPPKPQKSKISKEEEAAMLHTSQIQAFIRRSKVPALLSYLSNNSIPPTFIFYPPTPQNSRCPTALHLAASSNSPAIVLALLTKAKTDPTLLNGGEGKPAFDLAGDRATRDAFRVARHELGESVWDWNAAHVPSAISRQEAEGREEREKKAANEAEAQRRKDEMERIRREDDEKARSLGGTAGGKRGGARTLASVEKSFAEKREEETRGMTPEMRARLERERRARAAEERIRRMQAGSGS